MAGKHSAEQQARSITIRVPTQTIRVPLRPRVDYDDPEVQAAIRRGTLTHEGRPACEDAFCNDSRDHELYGKPGHSWDGNPE